MTNNWYKNAIFTRIHFILLFLQVNVKVRDINDCTPVFPTNTFVFRDIDETIGTDEVIQNDNGDSGMLTLHPRLETNAQKLRQKLYISPQNHKSSLQNKYPSKIKFPRNDCVILESSYQNTNVL